MCIGNTLYITVIHNTEIDVCERERVLIASEQATSENNDGWMDMYRQGYKGKSMVLQSGWH